MAQAWENRTRFVAPGVQMAGLTALVSGLAVFVNSYGVHAASSPTVYTTAKNLVAALLLAALAAGGLWVRRRGRAPLSAGWVAGTRLSCPESTGERPSAGWPRWARLAGIGYVGIVGGGLAFALFFQGLSKMPATPAAFLHDTLVVWVAALAVPFLGEKVRTGHLVALGLLVVGQVVFLGGIGHLAANRGAALVLGATLLWAVEVVVIKALLKGMSAAALSLARMSIGALALLGVVLAGPAGLPAVFSALGSGWVLLTGLLLACYVASWTAALARGRALDVTAVLVASVPLTAAFQAMAGATVPAPQLLGIAAILAGAGLMAASRPRTAAA